MKIPLSQGAYQAKSLIADAQKCINLYPEKNPEDAPFPVTHYHTPGILLQDTTTSSINRGLYRASNNAVFVVYGQSLLQVIISGGVVTFGATLGTLIGSLTTPVSMSDNGLILVIVDGSTNGYAVDLQTLQFGVIPGSTAGPFYGADRVDYCDTFFTFNRPGTKQWYISLSNVNFMLMTTAFGSIIAGTISSGGMMYTDGTYTNVNFTGGTGFGYIANVTVTSGAVTSVVTVSEGQNYVVGDLLSAPAAIIGVGGSGFVFVITSVGGAFDPLDIASKEGSPDNITSLIVMHREVWLVGVWSTEVWYDAGAADFAFQALPGAFIEHGCVAKYTLCAQDLNVYFLSQDRQGQLLFLKGENYTVQRISTHAIEAEWATYPTVTDAIAFTYQQEGHVFIVVNFPSADKTWVYDQTTGLWHQRAWADAQGNLHRIRPNCYAFSQGVSIVGDWQDNALYTWEQNINYDETTFQSVITIPRIRSFPHMVENSVRVTYISFIADMEAATERADTIYPGSTDVYPPLLNLRFSDDRGKTYGNYIQQTMGAEGQYLTNIKYWRLGMARDRVFELSWSLPAQTALNGAWVEIEAAET